MANDARKPSENHEIIIKDQKNEENHGSNGDSNESAGEVMSMAQVSYIYMRLAISVHSFSILFQQWSLGEYMLINLVDSLLNIKGTTV